MNQRLTILIGILTTLCVAACGGEASPTPTLPPPPGAQVEYSRASIEGFFCGRFQDQAHVLRTKEDVASALQGCNGLGDATAPTALEDAVAALADDELLLYVSVTLGGCIQSYEIIDIKLDGDTLRPWVSKANTALGVTDAACTDDIGESHDAFIVKTDATAAVPHITEFNPDQGKGPSLSL